MQHTVIQRMVVQGHVSRKFLAAKHIVLWKSSAIHKTNVKHGMSKGLSVAPQGAAFGVCSVKAVSVPSVWVSTSPVGSRRGVEKGLSVVLLMFV